MSQKKKIVLKKNQCSIWQCSVLCREKWREVERSGEKWRERTTGERTLLESGENTIVE
jgi:hypothetical protein